jgi:hypothetical protein
VHTTQRVRPREYRGDLENPHRGTTTFQRFNGDPVEMRSWWNDRDGPTTFPSRPVSLRNDSYPDSTVAYCRWAWKVFEPEMGAFRWDLIDGALKAAAERGQTLAVRIQPYVSDMRLPDWMPEKLRTAENAGRYAPDHNTPEYVAGWTNMIRACGERYDGQPALESFDVAYGGACGEGGGNSTPETAEVLVQAYLDSFRKSQLLTMLGTHGCLYAQQSGRGNIGWRADCFGDLRDGKPDDGGDYPRHLRWNHMYDLYPREIERCGVADAWKTAPIVMETCWTVSHWFNSGWDIDWILEQGLTYHTSVFMPKSSYIPKELTEKIAQFNRRLGYRFVLRQMQLPLDVRKGVPAATAYTFDNVGVAPIYRDYVLALRFRQGEQHGIVELSPDLRKWLPGQTYFEQHIVVPDFLEPGVAAVDMAIVDRATHEPRVRLAIEGVLEDGWHPLTHVDVQPDNSN